MSRTIPPMKHSPHADDCPAVGGTGGHNPRRGVCNCGRFYPPAQGTFPGDLDRMPSGHTRHCEARMKWGDGECECRAASPGEEGGR